MATSLLRSNIADERSTDNKAGCSFFPGEYPNREFFYRRYRYFGGEDKLLGEFNEFVISNTIQGMLAAIKRFQIFMKRKEEENTGENYKDLV